MPQRDGTGPTGKGPRTGRSLGRCRGKDASKAEGQGSSGPIGRFLFNRATRAVVAKAADVDPAGVGGNLSKNTSQASCRE